QLYWLSGVYMIATWRWPKASLSVSSMSCGVMPRRDAVARSITSDDCRPPSCWSLLKSTSCGSARRRSATRGPHASSSRTSSPWSVYWYWAFPMRPPARTSCTAWEERGAPRHRPHPAAQPGDHLVGADLPLRERLQHDEEARGVGSGAGPVALAAREPHHVGHRRVAPDDVHDLGQLAPHRLERDVLGGLDRPLQPPGVLLGKEPLGHHPEEVAVQRDGQDGHREHAARMPQHPGERRVVVPPHPLEGPLARSIEPAVLAVRLPGEEGGAHHRRGG